MRGIGVERKQAHHPAVERNAVRNLKIEIENFPHFFDRQDTPVSRAALSPRVCCSARACGVCVHARSASPHARTPS